MKVNVKCSECSKDLVVSRVDLSPLAEIVIEVCPCKSCIDEIAGDNKDEIESYRNETNELYKEIASLKEELKRCQENVPQE